MTIIAVAGGTGALGHAIVDAFVSEGKHTVIVLARQVRIKHVLQGATDDDPDPNLPQTSESKEKELGTRILAVDYNDIDGLATSLNANKVEIVISTLNLMQGTAAEHALIKAAAKSPATKRYVANNWGIRYTEE
jgi:predicted dinucleotide-binding enzyme